MLSNADKSFISRDMKIELGSIEEKLNDNQVRNFKGMLEAAITEFVRVIRNHIDSGVKYDINNVEENDAEKYINNYAQNLLSQFTNDAVKEVLGSLQHAFSSFAFNGLHQLFTRQENEVWYPKVILDSELKPNDIDRLPNSITLYRGTDYNELNMKKYGQSWTTCDQVACDFAFKHYTGQSWFIRTERVVLRTVFPKKHVYFSDQKCEFEVVINTHKIGEVQHWEPRIEPTGAIDSQAGD